MKVERYDFNSWSSQYPMYRCRRFDDFKKLTGGSGEMAENNFYGPRGVVALFLMFEKMQNGLN